MLGLRHICKTTINVTNLKINSCFRNMRTNLFLFRYDLLDDICSVVLPILEEKCSSVIKKTSPSLV